MISRIIRKNDEDALYFIPIFPIFLLAMVLYVLLSSLALAEGSSDLKAKVAGESEVKLTIDAASGSFVKEMRSRFEIRGEITSYSGDQLTIAGQTVLIQPNQVERFRQKGVLRVGARVKITGIIRDGHKIAEDIMILGQGQGRFQFNLEDLEIGDRATVGVGTSLEEQNKVQLKAVGPIDEVINFLQQILAYLKNLVKKVVVS